MSTHTRPLLNQEQLGKSSNSPCGLLIQSVVNTGAITKDAIIIFALLNVKSH